MKKTKISLLAIALAAMTTHAVAGTSTGTFNANATLNSSCIVSVNNVSFGTVSPSATGVATATSSVNYQCSKGLKYVLSISSGNGTVANRSMKGSLGDTLNYNIYTDANTEDEMDAWGDGSVGGTGAIFNMEATGKAQTLPIYGRLPLNQFVKPDTYTDTLTVILQY